MVISPSSSGWRSVSRICLSNSRNSSRKSIPRCAREISPGRESRPPPMMDASLAVWWMMRNGRSRMIGVSFERSHATEYIRESSICSSISIEGSIPARALASMVFPLHGGHCMRMLCPQAAAMRSARFACSCPWIEEKSTHIWLRGRLDMSSGGTGVSGFSPVRSATASRRDSSGMISTSGMTEASRAFSLGRNTLRIPISRASIVAGRAHWTGRTPPSRASSPRKSELERIDASNSISFARIPRAIGRS